MKKLNFVIFGTLLAISLATQAFAETTIPWTKEGCESVKGTWITAHSATDAGCDSAHCNGLNFCQSNVSMNWWSAFVWCKSIGHELVDLETACPKGMASGGSCANLANKVAFWTWNSAPGEISTSTRALLNNGSAIAGPYITGNGPLSIKQALCKE